MAVLEAISYQTESRYYYHLNGISSTTTKPEAFLEKKRRIVINKKDFLLCGSCFWCASYFNNVGYTISTTAITKCPSCNNNNRVESIPISYDEVYKFDYDPKHGVALEFSKVDEEEEILN